LYERDTKYKFQPGGCQSGKSVSCRKKDPVLTWILLPIHRLEKASKKIFGKTVLRIKEIFDIN